ncbi:MAG: NAD-glutamate dehydrogenase [Moraxella sp.]|nr:NAD-glutamate dehydrogenase [Moraxella sp.]
MSGLRLNEKELQALSDIACKMMNDDKGLLARFVSEYYQFLNKNTVQDIDVKDLAGMAVHHFNLIKQYDKQGAKLVVANPSPEEQQFYSQRTVIQMVAQDRPFLIDTMLMVLDGLGVTVHRLYNTILRLSYTDGVLTDLAVAAQSNVNDDNQVALLHCEIDRQDGASLADIQTALLARLDEIDVIVADYPAMLDCLGKVQDELNARPIPENYRSKAAVVNFLKWMGQDNFIFMGYREYRFDVNQDVPALYSVGGTGLGVLRGGETDTVSKSFLGLSDDLKHLLAEPRVILLSKSSHIAKVHRPVYMDYLGVQKYDDKGQLIGEYRFVGLLTSRAYQTPVSEIPMLQETASAILTASNLPKNGHAYTRLAHIINTLPRDDLFQASSEELAPIVAGIASLQDKNSLRLFTRIDHYRRFVSCLVYIPKHKFDTSLRTQIQERLVASFGGLSSAFRVEFNEINHVRVHIHVRTQPGKVNAVDVPALEETLNELMQDWADEYAKALGDEFGESVAGGLVREYLPFVPVAYQERYDVHTAVADTKRIRTLDELTDGVPMIWYLYQSASDNQNQLRLKLYGKDEASTLSNVLPVLESFGVAVLSAQTYRFDVPNAKRWLQEYRLKVQDDVKIDLAVVKGQFEQALQAIWQGKVEFDRLNELILNTKLSTQDVLVLRALSRYIVQANAPFSNEYIHQTLINNQAIAVLIAEMFHAKMSPSEQDLSTRAALVQELNQEIESRLVSVTSLDEDRIIRWFLDLLNAMLRTNFYQVNSDGQHKDRLSFKFRASDIPRLPKPKPMFEIYVYSPRVEGVHLRGGKVARGGLRWSDRMEDYRTEVLGLVKAQMVKNAVIVPVGSKGGFVCKDKSKQADRESWQAEGVACYQTYLRGLLDITDNIIDGQIVPPTNTVRHDEDDPYLVVAADKGTASFSDIANGLSAEYGFWLQDAFASGGSAGYDHKGMGITARGAWESVKRHFRLLNKDIQTKDEFSVVGIGDMSGDVFGNGMLLSKNILLKAAFNHLHIFIDPNPVAATSFAERERLFKLPRSQWSDYDKGLISQGGGVFSRSEKSITITPQMQATFDIAESTLTPNELLSRLLKAPVDLIWNGGIGTYIKASDEDHSDVGDRANDAIRVNGGEVRAKIVGEGGNLGCTQKGRIEYAQNGGRIYTDAIDNSGGVNCSDHEVNIKILLGASVSAGDMTVKQRNTLLESMTDDVANLVLRQNYLQPQAIELSAYEALARLGEHGRFMQFLESRGRLDRAIEYLPSDDVILTRHKSGKGLSNPEFAVLLAYGKMWVYDEMLASDLPDDGYFLDELKKYFPNALAATYFDGMKQHRLHREIICTYLTNGLVNRMGIENIFGLHDEAGFGIADIARAYAVVRDVFDIQTVWNKLGELDNQVNANLQLALEINIRRVMKQGMLWFLTHGDLGDVAKIAATYKSQVSELLADSSLFDVYFNQEIDEQVADLTQAGLSEDYAFVFARLPVSVHALDVVAIATAKGVPAKTVVEAYFGVYQTLQMAMLNDKVAGLPKVSYWDRKAATAITTQLHQSLLSLVDNVLGCGGFELWQSRHQDSLANIKTGFDELDDQAGLAGLSVILAQVNGLMK